tara:strand:+ start:787 stop:4581 length:3795 start_codon:yes stop_codon:yes gene_type:complete
MKKVTLFTAEIDTKAIIKKLADYKQSLEKIKASQKNLNTSTAKGAEQFVKNQVEIKKIKAESLKYEKVVTQLEKGSKGLMNVNKSLDSTLKREVVTINQARESNKKLLAIRNNLNLKSKEGIAARDRINKQLDKNNKLIKTNVAGLEKQKINIGNYGSAVGKVTGALKRMVGAFAIFNLIKNSFKVVKEFEQSQANLASVLGVNINEMKGLTEQAKELGATTTFTASQVAELALEFAKLGFSQPEIEGMTEATLALAEATGSELGEAASVVGATMRGFGLEVSETQRVTDVMAKSFSSSSLDMAKFSTAMASVAPVAKLAGVGLEETTALLGTLTDRGIDASTAGTGLRNMFLKSNKAGLTFDEALQQINSSSDKSAASMELFGLRGATLGVILSETQGDVESLTEKVTDSEGAAARMAETQRNTLGGAIKLLRSAWEGLVLKFEEGTGVFGTVKDITLLVADNLTELVKVVGIAGGAWLAYKTVVALSSVQSFLMQQQALLTGKAMASSAKGVGKATFSFKAFNRALKANALFLAIGALVALVAVVKKLNKPLSETVDELNKANAEFREQSKASVDLSNDLNTMADRYDVLKNKTEKSKDEQKELDGIIKDIAKNVPDAVTEVDKYGDAIDINTDKVKEFNKANGEIMAMDADIMIDKQTISLKKLQIAQDKVNAAHGENAEGAEKSNGVYIEGVGIVKKVNGVLQEYNKWSRSSRDLTKEQKKNYKEYVLTLEEGIKTTQKEIEGNEDIIASVTGVTNARQDGEAIAKKNAEETATRLAAELKAEEDKDGDAEKNAKKRLDNLRKSLKAEVDLSKLRLDMLRKENKESGLLTGVEQAEVVRKAKLEILKKEEKAYENSSKFKDGVDEERELQRLKFNNERLAIDAEFVDESARLAIESSEEIIENYKLLNQSKIKDAKFVNDELFNLEAKRIDETYIKEIEALEQLELSNDEYLKRLNIINEEANEADAENKNKRRETELTQQEIDFENRLELRRLNGESEFQLRIEELERLRQEELRVADLTGADISLINEKYSKATAKVVKTEQDVKVDANVKSAQAISGVLKQLAGENKEIAITAALIDGALGIQSILSDYPKFDGGFAMVAAMAAAAITTATSVSTIQKAEKGISFQGTLQGASHAQGGINLGNGIEAEGGENMYSANGQTHIVNKKASTLINRMGIMGALSYINQREGNGVALNTPTSYASKGGLISTLRGGNVEIDYNKMAQAFESGASRVQNTVNVTEINNANNNIAQIDEFSTV